ncbi:MAG: hypothetical protein DRI90_13765 [Deltaproteobacteria bacterium]|nr:MAG: hypothetical protein DRI90_13765 [Deltaproteobacteria bacterium]
MPDLPSPKPRDDDALEGASGAFAVLIAWFALGIVNAVVIAFTVRSTRVVTAMVHHLFDAGQFLALGLASSALVEAWTRWGRPKRHWNVALLFAGALGLGSVTLTADLEHMSQRVTLGVPPSVVLWGSVTAVALTIPIAWLVGRLLARPLWRWLAVLAGCGVQVGNAIILPNDYPAAHLYLALAASTLAAASIGGVRLPRRFVSLLTRRRGRIIAGVVRAIATVVAAFALVHPPPPSVTTQLLRGSGSVLPPYLGQLHSFWLPSSASVTPYAAAWYSDRTKLDAIAPSGPPVMGEDPIVILLSVDALRADLVSDAKHDASLPNIAKLRDQSLRFVNARTPGSQTVYTITALFSGIYFSQQYWSKKQIRKTKQLWPHEDPTVRFPQLLTDGGVATVHYSGADWMRAPWGVVRGFKEETWVRDKSHRYSRAHVLAKRVAERIKRHGSGPMFLFVHFLDPHAPYNLSSVKGSSFERYVGECAMVDEAIGEIERVIRESSSRKRVMVVVTGDHGEAFGEHHSKHHATTLYDEVLRVPLLIRAHGIEPRDVSTPVSLIDLGPTFLDLFQQPTPAYFMGETLVPFMRGANPTLHRPIVAEGRLKRSLVMPNGYKLIVDQRRKTVELYDLKADPEELDNLADDEQRVQPALALMTQFFDAHQIKRKGYKIPYRR